ncbi:MAG: permease-like cell division protein FtsX [Defluviitaleaceae bacterium]|nr:permease-like cell division protein FtsX [Defluviitaleaceae bacterium]
MNPSTNKDKKKKKVKRKKERGGLGLRNLTYYFSQTFKSILRNKFMSLTSVLTVASCIIIVIASFVVVTNINAVLEHWEDNLKITVHVEDDLTAEQRDLLYHQLLVADNIVYVQYISPEEALENLIGSVLADAVVASEDHQQLRHTFEVILYDTRALSETSQNLSGFFGVYTLVYPADATEALIRISNVVTIIGIVVVSVLAVLSVVIITNTIKLTVNSRRNEILIMKYVGATNWFVRWPFVIEGLLIGVLGAAIPLAATWVLYDVTIEGIAQPGGLMAALIGDTTFRATGDIFPFIAPIIIIFGAGIGILGSVSSMRRHLNV